MNLYTAGKAERTISNMEVIHHYPPDLFDLLVETVPRLSKSKAGLLTFFQGAGVDERDLSEHRTLLAMNKDGFKKPLVARAILTRLNERGDATLRARRELLKRVCEFQDFSVCWDNDQLPARGGVTAIRELVKFKDGTTRAREAEEQAQRERGRQHAERMEAKRKADDEFATVERDLATLFSEGNPWRRGKALEGVLNRLFKAAGILIKEAFTVRGNAGEGVVEQIDGVITLDGHIYLVEMKWHQEPLGNGDVSHHLVRLHSRAGARGFFIAANGFTAPAVTIVREHLSKLTVVLCGLDEIVLLLHRKNDLRELLSKKVEGAVLHKDPYVRPFG